MRTTLALQRAVILDRYHDLLRMEEELEKADKSKFFIWFNPDFEIYEIVHLDGTLVTVQTNILTDEKAKEALRTWRNRAEKS